MNISIVTMRKGSAAVLTDDTLFENTGAAPDGRRVEEKWAVLEFWRIWIASNVDSTETEDAIFAGDRAVVL